MAKKPKMKKTEIRHVRSWLKSGWFIVKQDVPFWLTMAAIYISFALILSFVPLLGPLILLLITPVLFGGALSTAHSLTRILRKKLNDGKIRKTDKPNFKINTKTVVKAPKALYQLLENIDAVFPLMFLSIILLAVVVVLRIIVLMITGGASATGMSIWGQGFAHAVNVFLGGFLLFASYFVLSMGMFFTIHRILFAREMFLQAIATSFFACAKNLVPLSALTFIFLIPVFVAIIITSYTNIGYILLVLVCLLALPLFATSSYLSYRKIFD